MAESSEDRTELVITRRPGQSLWLRTASGEIKITQLARWRLSIEAPRDVTVVRSERRGSRDDA
jgi:sRNA-binding carbon storage regulator CsrA